ncbi:MAG: NAD(P)-dependent glycerol-3-phosphate dehydrogenase [Kiritimatiellae bacterium]|nr:NAD(P)-dependent glycerol-3-phosphate dehydrogenase [Kiritimatiellia bacterium]
MALRQVAILGDGGWGTALALVLHQNGHGVRVWGPFPDYIAEIKRTRENRKFLPGVRLPAELLWTSEREEAIAGADAVVLAVPSRFFKSVVTSFAGILPKGALVVSVAKGLDQETHKRMSETAEAALGRGPVAALSGPSHAEEVARGVPTAVVIACADHGVAEQLQQVFNGPAFRVYTSDDIVGVELGGALKNIIALAAGISDGIGFGDNTKAALITRGLAEIARLGCALGAHPATFAGLSGMGDLIVTCASRLSRNRAVGERLGRGEKMADILAGMEQVAEGVWTCGAARALAQEAGVEVPITAEVDAVLHEGKDPRAAVQALLSRDPRPERD